MYSPHCSPYIFYGEENLLNNQDLCYLLTISYLLITFMFDWAVLLEGEIKDWSVLWVKLFVFLNTWKVLIFLFVICFSSTSFLSIHQFFINFACLFFQFSWFCFVFLSFFFFCFTLNFKFQTRKVESHLEWDIHFWLGSTTSQVLCISLLIWLELF